MPRLALVIGSECTALGRLGFVSDVTRDVHARLTDPRDGGWTSIDESGPLINPPAHQLAATIVRAVERADELEATLLIWFLGHGVQTGELDMYLMGVDSPAKPTSLTAVLLSQVLREELNFHPRVDGLVLVIDACEGGELVRSAGARLVDRSLLLGQRLELLTASADGPAFDGCLSRTFLTLTSQDRHRQHLGCHDLKAEAGFRCRNQEPTHLALNARRSDPQAPDEALWLIRNHAFTPDALTGLTQEGRVTHSNLLITESLRDMIQAVVDADSAPVRWISGPPGSGKTTALSLLYRSQLVRDLVPEDYLDCLISLRTLTALNMTFEHEVVAQVCSRYQLNVPVTAQANIGKLVSHVVGQRRRIRIGVDGFDELPSHARLQVLKTIQRVISDPNASRVRFIVTSRTPPPVQLIIGLTHLRMSLLSQKEIQGAAALAVTATGPFSGRTIHSGDAALVGEAAVQDPGTFADKQLLSRFVLSVFQDGARIAEHQKWLPAVLCLTAATGTVPLPLDLGQAALARLGIPATRTEIHDRLQALSPLTLRFEPGEATEAIALIHESFHLALNEWADKASEGSVLTFHGAIADLLQEVTTLPTHPWYRYARLELERHLIAAGRFSQARSWSWASVDRTVGQQRRGRS